MRNELYDSLSNDFHDKEMDKIISSNEWHCQFIQDDDGRTIGFIEVSERNIVDGCLSSPVAYIEGLYLEQEYRGKGLGKEIIKVLLDWCKEKEFSELAVDTELENIKAQKFYLSAGFEETYRIVEFKIDV